MVQMLCWLIPWHDNMPGYCSLSEGAEDLVEHVVADAIECASMVHFDLEITSHQPSHSHTYVDGKSFGCNQLHEATHQIWLVPLIQISAFL